MWNHGGRQEKVYSIFGNLAPSRAKAHSRKSPQRNSLPRGNVEAPLKSRKLWPVLGINTNRLLLIMRRSNGLTVVLTPFGLAIFLIGYMARRTSESLTVFGTTGLKSNNSPLEPVESCSCFYMSP